MTTTTKHTPGPWALDEVRTGCGRAFRIGSGEMLKAGKGCCIIYDDYPGNPENERKANACLIAAAPDLMDACDFALTILEALGNGKGDAAMACRAALAKARGEG